MSENGSGHLFEPVAFRTRAVISWLAWPGLASVCSSVASVRSSLVANLLQKQPRGRGGPFRRGGRVLGQQLLDGGEVEVAPADFDQSTGQAPGHLPKKVGSLNAEVDLVFPVEQLAPLDNHDCGSLPLGVLA